MKSPLAAIAAHCRDCCDANPGTCNVTTCQLYPYRQGKDPRPKNDPGLQKEHCRKVIEERARRRALRDEV